MGIVWVVPVALVVGVALGALGGGGAILTIPALIYLVGQDAKAATTGSLIIVGISSAIAMLSHHRAGRVRLAQGAVFGAIGVVGSYAGAKFSAAVPSTVLLSAFSVLMFVVAALMWRRRRAAGAASLAPGNGARPAPTDGARSAAMWVRTVAVATGVGLLTGFFGVGGGFAIVPGLVLALGFTMPEAVGTSLLVIAINSATALVARMTTGVSIDWPVLLTFAALAVIGSLVGAEVAKRVDPRRLSLAFIVLLVAVGTYMAAMNIPHLMA